MTYYFTFYKGSSEQLCLEGSEKELREVSTNSFNLLWVTDEVTTGHGTDTCLWHPRPHVQPESWNLIYWGVGHSQYYAVCLFTNETYCVVVTVCSLCRKHTFLLRFKHWEEWGMYWIFTWLFLLPRRLAGNDLSFIHPEAMSGLHQLKVL